MRGLNTVAAQPRISGLSRAYLGPISGLSRAYLVPWAAGSARRLPYAALALALARKSLSIYLSIWPRVRASAKGSVGYLPTPGAGRPARAGYVPA